MHVVPRIMRQPEAFLDPQNAPKSLAAGASPQIPLGELTALPRHPSWIQGVLLLRLLLLRGGEGRGKEGSGGEGGEWRGREGRGGEGLPRLEITSGYALGRYIRVFTPDYGITYMTSEYHLTASCNRSDNNLSASYSPTNSSTQKRTDFGNAPSFLERTLNMANKDFISYVTSSTSM